MVMTRVYNKLIVMIIIITSSSDLQPSTAVANQLPGQLVYTQITTRGPDCFKFIIALIMLSRTSYKQKSNCLIVNMLHHKACNAGAVSIMSGAYTHVFSLHATSPQQFSTPHMELLKLLAS